MKKEATKSRTFDVRFTFEDSLDEKTKTALLSMKKKKKKRSVSVKTKAG